MAIAFGHEMSIRHKKKLVQENILGRSWIINVSNILLLILQTKRPIYSHM